MTICSLLYLLAIPAIHCQSDVIFLMRISAILIIIASCFIDSTTQACAKVSDILVASHTTLQLQELAHFTNTIFRIIRLLTGV